MRADDIYLIPTETLNQYLLAIPFYKAVRQQSEAQYLELMRYSRVFYYKRGEQVIDQGVVDDWSYFLIKGQLVVSLRCHGGHSFPVSAITPGETFGDLAVLLQTQRTADVYVDEHCREAIAFGTDFTLFGSLSNFNGVSIATKLIYYRHAVHALRWKLDLLRSRYPDNPLANQHWKIKLYTGPKDGEPELYALHEQSIAFSRLLIEWNQLFRANRPVMA